MEKIFQESAIPKNINGQLDIRLKQFTVDELDAVIRKIKNRKSAGFNEMPAEVWKTRKFEDILLRLCNADYKQNTVEERTRSCIFPDPKKEDLGITKNYSGLTLTAIVAKVYNTKLLNCIRPEIGKILRKNQNAFRRNRSTASQILRIHRIIEGIQAKNLEAILQFVDISKAFDSI